MPAKKTTAKGKKTKAAQKKVEENTSATNSTSENSTQSAQSGGKKTKATKATKAATKTTKAATKTTQKAGAKATKATKTTKAATKTTKATEEDTKPTQEAGATATASKAATKTTKAGTKATKTTTRKTAQKGGKSSSRFFKVIVDGNEAHGRFSGMKPKQAASKALSSILKSRDDKEGKIKFSIIECTRGSKHKQYNYIGERKELKKPMKVIISKGTDKEKTITYKYNNRVMKDLPKNE